MKLIRYGELNKEKPGVVIDGICYDVSALGEDYNEVFFETGGLTRLTQLLETNKDQLERLPEGIRLGSP
ncbi:MAG TPA: ureidoglycolate lyase, partial [Pedobacter sp.]